MKSRQLSFSGGEISPALYGRVDQTKYETGLKICRNFIVMRHGGLSNRAGSSIVAEVKDSTKNTRLIPFIFNPTQTYVLEVGDRYMRLIRNGGQITLPAVNIINISKSNPVYIYAVGHNCNNGDEIYIEGIQGMTELNGRNFIVSNRTPTTLSLLYKDVNYGQPVNASNFNEYTGLGTVNKIYETETPYLEEDIDDLIYIQSADVMTIVHPKYKVRELTRTGHTNWALNVVGFGPSIASPTSVVVTKGGAGTNTYKYKVTAIDIATLEESLPSSAAETTSAAAPTTSAPHVLTWAAVTNVLQYEIYKEQDDFYGWIGTAGSTGFDDTGYSIDASDNPPNDRQPFEANDDYPSAATYIQQRLLLAGSNNSPYTCYGSKSGLLKNFMISSPLQDDDAITFPILGGQVNTIKHLLDIGKLLVFTSGGEFIVQGDNAGILLRGTKREDVERGQVLAKPGAITPHTEFNCEIYVLSKDEGGRHTPFFKGYKPQFYFRTTDVTGEVILPAGTEMVMPGDNIALSIILGSPIAMEAGIKFAIREGGRTVGAGVVTKITK